MLRLARTRNSTFKLALAIAIALAGVATLLLLSFLLSSRAKPLAMLDEDQPVPGPPGESTGDTAAAGKTAPPRFRPAFDQTEDPNSPSYDPAELARSQKIKVENLFEQEPRDEPWASQRQETLGTLLEQEISAYPGAALVSTECRRYSCKYVVDVPRDKFQDYRRGSLGLGNVVKNVETIESPDREGFIRLSRIAIVKRQFKDQQQFTKEFLPAVRRSQESMRERRRAEQSSAQVDPLLLPKQVTP
jgi:hypothetical protein